MSVGMRTPLVRRALTRPGGSTFDSVGAPIETSVLRADDAAQALQDSARDRVDAERV